MFNTIKRDKNDILFSQLVRGKQDWRCQKCGTKFPSNSRQLTCSHFWSRRYKSTRFDFDNCDSLCIGCHIAWEKDKQGEYRDFMIKKLGQEKYDKLRFKAHEYYSYKQADKDRIHKELKELEKRI